MKKVEHPLQGAHFEIEEMTADGRSQFLVTAWGATRPGGALCGCAHFAWCDDLNAYLGYLGGACEQHEKFNDALHAGITQALVRLYDNQIAGSMEGATDAKS